MTAQRTHVRYGGREHPVLVRVPDGSEGADRTLLLVLHGSGGNAEVALEVSGLDVRDAPFVVVAPQGATPLDTGDGHPGGGWAWNVPGVPFVTDDAVPERDDVDYLLHVAAELGDRFGVARDRSVLVGFSGGARMACAVAAAAPDAVAGVGAVAGLRAGRASGPDFRSPEAGDLHPGPAVPVIAFHGTDDPVNPFDGDGEPRWGYTVPLAAEQWARRNGVAPVADVAPVTAHVERHRFGAGEAGEVVLYATRGDGHTWPGSSVRRPFLGHQTDEVSATALMVDFFTQKAREAGSRAGRR